jgi:hypothetical protein
VVVINLSGRGDKDLETYIKWGKYWFSKFWVKFFLICGLWIWFVLMHDEMCCLRFTLVFGFFEENEK